MKPILMRLWPYLLGMAVGTLIVAGGIAALTSAVRAASYNVFFNNVEQGPNSTASPTLNVQDGKATKRANAQAPEEAAQNLILPQAQPTTVANVSETQTQPVPVDSDQAAHKFRFGVSGFALGNSLKDFRKDGRLYGGAVSASYSILRDLAVTGFGGLSTESDGLYGGELEFVPVRFGLFGLNNFVEGGLLLGANNLGSDLGKWGSVHAGLRATLNLGQRFGLSATMRTNLTDRRSFDYVLAEAGLTVRF